MNYVLITQNDSLLSSEFLLDFLFEENDKLFAYRVDNLTWQITCPKRTKVDEQILLKKIKEIINPIFNWKKEGF